MSRIEALRAAMPNGFGAALIADPYNRAYLSRFSSSAGWLLITEQTAMLFADARYIEAAKQQAVGVEVVLLHDVYVQIAGVLADNKIDQLHIETQTTLADYDKISDAILVQLMSGNTLSDAVKKMRAVKDKAEIAAIAAAQEITDAAFSFVLGFIKTGRTEREIAVELDYFMQKNGADGVAFPTICAAGVHSSMPHAVPGDNRVQSGDFVTMDFGALKNGYCSDMTRTVAVGNITDEQRNVYETVLQAQRTAIEAAHAGITGAALDKTARDVITAAGYADCFGHGLGHSLGLEVHEEPRANSSNREALCENTVMTIEPGVYLEGRFGVRIEDMVVLRQNGCRDLTQSEQALIIV